jgi:hypothetical protein
MDVRLFLVIAFAAAMSAVAQEQPHDFSVKDEIAMVHFSDPSDDQELFDSNRINTSPDGHHFAIVTTRGLIHSDEIETALTVFDLREIKSFLRGTAQPPPKRLIVATIRARPHGEQSNTLAPLIQEVRWSVDSKSLYFKAMNALGALQLERVSVEGTNLRPLTPSNYSVDRYDVHGRTIAYTASKLGQLSPSQGAILNQDALDSTGRGIRDILFPGQLPYDPQTFTLRTLTLGQSETGHEVSDYSVAEVPLHLSVFPFQLSPDGHRLLMTMPVSRVEDSWMLYLPAYAHLRYDPADPMLTAPESSLLRPRRYVMIDLKTDKIVPLIDGPSAWSLGYADPIAAVWAPDGTRVLLTNVFLPLGPSDKEARKKPCMVASVDLPSMQIRCFFYQTKALVPSAEHVIAVAFEGDANDVALTMKSGLTGQSVRRYRLKGDAREFEPRGMESRDSSSIDSRDTENTDPSAKVGISIQQSLNAPPTMWATDKVTGASRQIWDPNPQLREVRLADASEYRWKDAKGNEWVGALVKPVGYIPGKRYPLVLQLYVFYEKEFLTSGAWPSAFAARELASDGFVVLQIRKKPHASTISEEETGVHLEAYRSAIQSLTDAGLVDPTKVGVVGFSMSCWYAESALVKAPQMFAAATIADGFDYSYMQYMLFGPGPPALSEQANQVRGGSFFSDAKARWFRDSLDFHLDQVTTPVRIEAMNPASLLAEWELYSPLYLQHKPVDLIYFPQGTHIHQRPLEQYESQQGNVDWMRFWLQGYEDSDPGKRAQYRRWEKMKESARGVGVVSEHP